MTRLILFTNHNAIVNCDRCVCVCVSFTEFFNYYVIKLVIIFAAVVQVDLIFSMSINMVQNKVT